MPLSFLHRRQSIGIFFEQQALDFLLAQGLQLRARNAHSRFGEIDLIMQEDNQIVFVEVRYRSNSKKGSAIASVDAKKQAKLYKTANYWMQSNQCSDQAARFDIIGIQPLTSFTREKINQLFIIQTKQQNYGLQWIKNGF